MKSIPRDLGARRHSESEAQFCDRRGREAAERARISDSTMVPCADPGSTAFPRPSDRLGFWEYGR